MSRYGEKYYGKNLAVIHSLLAETLGREPAEREVWLATAVAALETGFGSGRGWKDPDPAELAARSNNWGAVQTTSTVPGTYFLATDYHVNLKTGERTAYRGKFRVYPTPKDGARHFVQVLVRLTKKMVGATSAKSFAVSMRAGRYFEAPADQYAKSIQVHLNKIAKELGRPFPGGGKNGTGGSIVVALLFASAILWFRWRV